MQIDAGSPSSSSALLAQLQGNIASCRLCPSLNPWRQFEPDACGATGTGYVLVGEAPGYTSLERRRRFTGPAGVLIRRALRQVAHPRYRDLEDLFYMTDVVKCHPASDLRSTSNRSPRRREIHACIAYLREEIRTLKPLLL